MSSCYETFFKMDTMELDKRIGEAFSEASQEVPFESVTSVKLFLLAKQTPTGSPTGTPREAE